MIPVEQLYLNLMMLIGSDSRIHSVPYWKGSYWSIVEVLNGHHITWFYLIIFHDLQSNALLRSMIVAITIFFVIETLKYCQWILTEHVQCLLLIWSQIVRMIIYYLKRNSHRVYYKKKIHKLYWRLAGWILVGSLQCSVYLYF